MSSPANSSSSLPTQQFARHIGGFSLATLFSRILGYLRDALVVAHFGGGRLSDTYYAAFRIANLVRRTLGEGALTASFVPILEKERQKSSESAQAFFGSLWSGLVLVCGLLVILGILASRPLVLALTYGFTADPAKFDLTVQLTRILFPHLLFVTMAAAAQGALNVARRFFLPALAPITFSLSLIVYLLLLKQGIFPKLTPQGQIMGLALCAVIGGALEWLILLPPLFRAGFRLEFRNPWSHPGVKQVLLLMGPSILGLMVDQVDTLIEMTFASFMHEGAFTAIYNANRIMQLPLALFGVATASVALPHLSQKLGQKDMVQYRETLGLSLRLLGFVLIPASVGLLLLSLPIVQTLFQHGQFTLQQSLITHQALFFAAWGLLAFSLIRIAVISFFSLEDAITPVKVNLLEITLNAILCYALMRPMGVGGLTLAASLSSWVSVLLLFKILSDRIGGLPLASVFQSWTRTTLASLGMALFLWEFRKMASLPPWALTFASMPLALTLYLGLARLLHMEEVGILASIFRRKNQ
ncbi:MAG: murein biosynthesis integral membrane protein MurJ [Elusimicrobia bacterium]|nr:murein biosynthesis integral membrane protein MurJ [Elusimicrobiota bacterium]